MRIINKFSSPKYGLYLTIFSLVLSLSIFTNSTNKTYARENNNNIVIEENSENIEEEQIDPFIYQEDANDFQNEDKKSLKEYTLDPDKKGEIYESRGTIVENRNNKGEIYNVGDNKLELLKVKTIADNELYLLIDYKRSIDQVILLGETTEQELSSLTDNITQRQKQEELQKEREELERQKSINEENQEDLNKENNSKLKNIVPIISILIVGVIVYLKRETLKVLFKKYKKN